MSNYPWFSAHHEPRKRTLAERLWLADAYGLSFLGMILSIFAVLAVAVLAIGITGTVAARAYGHTTCNNWGSETGIATKFVVLNWGDSGTCLAQTPDGRWVLNSKWTAFVKGDK